MRLLLPKLTSALLAHSRMLLAHTLLILLREIGTHSFLKTRMSQVKSWGDTHLLPDITLTSIQLVRFCPLANGCMPTATDLP